MSSEKKPKSNLMNPSTSNKDTSLNQIHPSFIVDEFTERRQAIHGVGLKDNVLPLTAKQNVPSNASFILGGDKSISKSRNSEDQLSPVSSPVSSHDPANPENPYQDDNKIHLLIGVSGTIGASKVILLVKKLFALYTHDKLAIKIVMTESALNILNLQDYGNNDDGPNQNRKSNWKRMMDLGIERVWTDRDVFNNIRRTERGKKDCKSGNSHFDLGKWADLLVIAPLSANTMAKVVNGIATNLLTSIVISWNSQKPIIAALSINNMAYSQPITKIHLDLMAKYFPFVQILQPSEKMIGKGNTSLAGMREWPDIVEVVMKKLGPPSEFGDDDDENEEEEKSDSEASDSESE